MAKEKKQKYWLFQANPANIHLKEALRADALHSYPVRSHKKKIRQGDRVILWQTGKEAGGYALATVTSPVEERKLVPTERRFFHKTDAEEAPLVSLRIDYNLWNHPLTPDMLSGNPAFEEFYAGSGGTNLKATEAQFHELESMVQDLKESKATAKSAGLQKGFEHPLNLVLSGPPGVGKTYHTVTYAVSIIENRPLKEVLAESRKAVRKRYSQYLSEGFIHFISFHQAFSYEDFVEGIKPRIENGNVVYEIEDGIFKQICVEAKRNIVESLVSILPKQEIRMDFTRLYAAFLEYLKSPQFETFTTRNGIQMYLHRALRNGNLTLRREKSFSHITISKTRLRKIYKQFPDDQEVNNEMLKKLEQAMEGTNEVAFWAVYDELKKFEEQYIAQLHQEAQENTLDDNELGHFDLNDYARQAADQSNRFVLIIDEINRGDVAAIFGDMISVIDADKREGCQEGMVVQLPHSKTFMCVPPNLYILATMDLMDSQAPSIIDMGLRRRFTFVEMEPEPKVVEQFAKQAVVEGIELAGLMRAINKRIEVLLTPAHCIGHAYFLDIENFDELRSLFANQLIPILKEYFFDNLANIGLVLGSGFVTKNTYAPDELFAKFEYENPELLKGDINYELTDPDSWDVSTFKSIYYN